MVWEIEIFETTSARSPVARFIASLPARLGAKLTRDIDLLAEFGFDLGNPYIKKLSGTSVNLWELRTRRGNDQVRTLFGVLGERRIILLHCFLKKSQRVPRREIETAEQRLKRVQGSIR